MSKDLLYHRCLPDLWKLSDSRVGRSRSGKTDRFNMINRFINRFTERCLPMYRCYSHSIIYVNVIQVFPDKFVEREILQLELHCPRFEKGCQWIGQLKHRQVLLKLSDALILQFRFRFRFRFCSKHFQPRIKPVDGKKWKNEIFYDGDQSNSLSLSLRFSLLKHSIYE